MTTIGDIPAPPSQPRRYTTRPFPSYRYVPGVLPHPVRDPAGHSYQPTPAFHRAPPWRPEEWQNLDDWLYGLDLFNARYFWEAHEAWEALWAAMPRDSEPALFLQGLIQIAAALLKAHLRSGDGVRVLSREGLDKLRYVASVMPHAMGLDLGATIAQLEQYFADTSVLPNLDRAPTLTLAVDPDLSRRG